MAEQFDLGVKEIWRFPIKSVGGERLAEAEICETGIRGDREFALFDLATSKIVSRKHRGTLQLAEVTASLDTERNTITVSHPTHGELTCDVIDGNSNTGTLFIGDEKVTGIYQEDQLGSYFSELYNAHYGLAKVPINYSRQVEPLLVKHQADTTYTDGHQLTIISQESIDAVAKVMKFPDGSNLLTNDQFRANLVLEGGPAFIEDYLIKLIISGAMIETVKASTRCVMTEHFINESGVAVRPQHWATLKALRKMGRVGYNGTNDIPKAIIAQNAKVLSPGKISDRSPVQIWEIDDKSNWHPAT